LFLAGVRIAPAACHTSGRDSGVEIEQLLTRLGVQFRILPDMFVERFQIAEALRLGDREHLGFDFRHRLYAHS